MRGSASGVDSFASYDGGERGFEDNVPLSREIGDGRGRPNSLTVAELKPSKANGDASTLWSQRRDSTAIRGWGRMAANFFVRTAGAAAMAGGPGKESARG